MFPWNILFYLWNWRVSPDPFRLVEAIRTSLFVWGIYKKIGFVCQTEFNLMMLWGQLVG